MPSPKSGKAGKAVSPLAPKAPDEADVADPGQVEEIKAEQRQTESGKYGSQEVTPFKRDEDEPKTGWIEIELIDMDDHPVPGAAYEIKLPDGTVASGALDSKGFARVEGFEAGQCEITFPELDQDAWEQA
ncbi:MAG: hypothetical protein EA378_04895 [Phycisphaerales bacterium]|nr:MAG: hypothetical protein EA378_04895 [Phycisphaerales bacterium]